MISSDALRKRYRELRASLGLSLREASKLLGVTSIELSRIEHGKPEDLVQASFEIDLYCHNCHKIFRGRPFVNVAFPHYICAECINNKSDGEEE